MMKETVVGKHSQTSAGFISIPVGTTAKGDSYYMQYGMCRFGNSNHRTCICQNAVAHCLCLKGLRYEK